MEAMTRLNELADRAAHPEGHPPWSRPSSLGGALAATAEQSRQRNQAVADALAEGYAREHPEPDDPEPDDPEPVDALGAASLARLFGPSRTQHNREETP
jgi:hypothetical protein